MLQPNDILTLDITDTTGEGTGICRKDDMVIFVPRTTAGDRVRLEIDSLQKNFAIGRCLEILSPSPDRKTPECPYFDGCGGCTMLYITRERELAVKENTVRQALRRMHIEADISPILCASPTHYRNKAVFHLSPVGDCGYFARESHTVLPGSHRCRLLPETLQQIAAFTEEYIKTTPSLAVQQPTALYLRRSQRDENIAVLHTEHRFSPEMAEPLKQYADALAVRFPNRIAGVLHGDTPRKKYALPTYTVLRGERYLYDSVLGLQIRLSPEGFYQVNPAGAGLLAQTVLSAAEQLSFSTAADLCCGSGFFALLLARRFPDRQVYGIEINPDSVRDAEVNKALNGLDNVRFFCGDAADFPQKTGVKPELITVDPPRAGCSERLCRQIIHLAPENVIYISCNPLTLARDLVRFSKAGYTVQLVQPVDMFPGTEHVETVVLLRRKIDVHKMNLNSSPFEMIKSGEKTIELRLYDEKRQQVKVGDNIIFTNTSTGETLNTTVTKLHRFNTFNELYKSLPLLHCGYTSENIDKATPSDMEQYYSIEEQNKYGIVGIELCRPKKTTAETVILLSRQKI